MKKFLYKNNMKISKSLKFGWLNMLVFLISIPVIQAQVTIGSGIPPEVAALLDIKSHEQSIDGGATTKEGGGGLLLPRVELIYVDELAPFINKGDYNADEYSKLKKRHTGLVVYNIATTSDFEPGTHIWDGSKWKMIGRIDNTNKNNWSLYGNTGTDPSTHFIGTGDSKDLVIKTDNTERIRITTGGRIGIHTNSPTVDFEVNGDTQINNLLFLKNTPKAPEDNVAQLVKDNNTGEVYAVQSSTNNTKAINYITYSISNMQSGDWIYKLDTQISVKDYTLVVVGSSFETNPAGLGLKVSKGSSGDYNPQAAYAYKKDLETGANLQTWCLNADYIGGEVADNVTNGTWHIFCLAINNSLMKIIPDIKHDMDGKSMSTAIKPLGL